MRIARTRIAVQTCSCDSDSLVINPIMVDNLSMHPGGSGVRLYDGTDLKLLILVGGTGALSSVVGPPGLK